MDKQAFNKENITELFSQLKKIISQKLGDKYDREITDLSKRIFQDLGINKNKELVLRVAAKFKNKED